MKLPSSNHGFTLVELLVGMSLGLFVMAGVLSSYTFLGRSLVRLANQQILETQDRRMLGYFTQDLKLAAGLDTSGTAPKVTPDSYKFTLIVPTGTTSKYITYYFNDTGSAATLSTFSIPAHSLVRIDLGSSTMLTLLSDITSGGLVFSYYDSSGASYTTYVDYLPGIKRMGATFSTQRGDLLNGTQTPTHQVTSARLVFRNKEFAQ